METIARRSRNGPAPATPNVRRVAEGKLVRANSLLHPQLVDHPRPLAAALDQHRHPRVELSNYTAVSSMKTAESHSHLLTERKTHVTYYYLKDAKGEWRWRLKASNGKIIADSGEGYKNEADCKAAIENVKRSRDAPVVEIKST